VTFEPHRKFLVGLAYRMLGSLAEAEDVVQDAFLRWSSADRADILHPRAYLARVVSRLCIDRMKSAASRREHYVGMWLPEPVIADVSAPVGDEVSVALLLTLERLSPLERAAFLLHDVFDMDYATVADTLERSEATCRQLAARAREHVRDERPRFPASNEMRTKIADAFQSALVTGDLDALARTLAEDAVFYSDGGGKRLAALNPIHGKEKILRFFAGIARKQAPPRADQIERVLINGLPGFVVHSEAGVETVAIEIEHDHVTAIYAIRNPDKLRHLSGRLAAL
jgi:RNA polymerase sigma-70 factor (ECF subfamily)